MNLYDYEGGGGCMLFIYDEIDNFERVADLQGRLEELSNEESRIREIMKKSGLPNHERQNCQASLSRLNSEIEKIDLRLRSMVQSL